MKFPNLWGQLFNVPLMLHTPVAETFASMFLKMIEEGSLGTQALNVVAMLPKQESFADNIATSRYASKRYTVTDSGVGVLPVYGVMVQRGGQISPDCSEMTSYQRLGATFAAMMSDADVRGILLEIDSPGGQVAGNFELANAIAAATGKPVWAHANEIAFSGGYSLAASAERLFAPMAGMVGSVGVIMQHVDQSAKDAKAGVVYTTIKAGANKDMLNPHHALSKADQAWAQGSVDRARDMFAQIVATGRSIDLKTVLDTEAGLLAAPDAKQIGFIDDIATFAETLAAFEERLSVGTSFVFTPAGSAAAQLPPTHSLQENPMSGKDPAATPSAAAAPAAPAPAPVVPAVAATAPATDAVDQKARIKAITGSEEANGRQDMANHLAFETDMSADAAKKLMSTAPKSGAANPLAALMGDVKNPKVGTDADVDRPAGTPSINTQEIYARRAKAHADARR